MERRAAPPDAGLDADLQDRLSGMYLSDPTGDDGDPDFAAWLAARELDLDEEVEAILERAGGGW